MKKKMLLTMIFGIIAMFFVACGGGDSNGDAEDVTTAGEDTEDATELTLWVFAAQHVDFYQDVVERWNEEKSEDPIKLKIETYPNDQMHNNLLLALQSDQGAPDIADRSEEHTSELQSRG